MRQTRLKIMEAPLSIISGVALLVAIAWAERDNCAQWSAQVRPSIAMNISWNFDLMRVDGQVDQHNDWSIASLNRIRSLRCLRRVPSGVCYP